MNLNFTVLRTLKSITYNVKTYYQFSNNEYRPTLVDITTDYGDNTVYLKPGIHRIIENMMRNYSNIFTKCPFQPGEYYLKDWNFAAQHLPSVVPAGRYLANITLWVDSNFAYHTATYFYVANHGILDLNFG